MCKKPKPCPFCGENAKIVSPSKKLVKVICDNDECPLFVETQWFESKRNAVRAWNHRSKKGDD